MNPLVRGVAIAGMIAAPFWAAVGYGIDRAVATPAGCTVSWSQSPTPYPTLGGMTVTPVLSGCNDGPYQTVLLDNGVYQFNALAAPYAVWVPAHWNWKAQFVTGPVSFTNPSSDTIISSTSGSTNLTAAVVGACHATFTISGSTATAHPNTACNTGFEFTSWALPNATGNSGETLVQRVTGPPWTVTLPPCRYQLDFRKVGGKIVSATIGGEPCTTTTTTSTTTVSPTTSTTTGSPTTTTPPKATTTTTAPNTTTTTPPTTKKSVTSSASVTTSTTPPPAPVAPIQPVIAKTTG